jgi:NADH-quinone oxidoreductase subunit J
VNTVVQVVFLIISALILTAGVCTVIARNLMHAALWLIAGLFGVGALYLLMEAEFAAVVQVMIYVGAVSILILFAIMLTPDLAGESDIPVFQKRWLALVVAAGVFGLLIVPTVFNHRWNIHETIAGAVTPIASTRELGISFMNEYLLPFELASVLLLAALIGAIVVGFDTGTRRRVLTLAEEFRLRKQSATTRQPVEDDAPATIPLTETLNEEAV